MSLVDWYILEFSIKNTNNWILQQFNLIPEENGYECWILKI